jgi:mannose-1-phosphate guanylyltransferase
VVSGADQRGQILDELPELTPDRLLIEPEPRGTGPALALAALAAERLAPGAVMVSLHADHHLPDEVETTFALLSAAWWAREWPGLVAVGVRPTRPATGFGYVEQGEELSRLPGVPAAALGLRGAVAFKEKPDAAGAAAMLRDGRYLWNTGLFAWPASLLLSEFQEHSPETLAAVRAAAAGPRVDPELWSQVTSGVVERLVLERSSRLGVLPTALEWSDLGSFLDLYQVAAAAGAADGEGNVTRGEVLLADSFGTMVDSAAGRLVAVVGASGLVVVDTEDAVLVCPMERVQEVSWVVEQLRRRGRADLL